MSAAPLRIAVASTGRSHVLDLARELAGLGHEVTFHSYVPRRRAAAYGLPERCHAGLLDVAWPYVAWERLAPYRGHDTRRRLLIEALDEALARRIGPCDVLLALSGIYLATAERARAAFGARIVVERGSTHVDAQRRVLEETPGARRTAGFTVARERASYALADRIAVPSRVVAESFAPWPELAAKLFVNPYGVDLAMFPRRPAGRRPGRRVLMVGGWSRRKGADVLTEALRQVPGAQFVHVGPLGDVPWPGESVAGGGLVHHGPVDQGALAARYHAADVAVLASREEGLALVQLQALACGLPLVASDRTGILTVLEAVPELAERVRVVRAGDADALAAALEATLADVAAGRIGEIDEAVRARLSWRAAAERYAAALAAETGR